MACSLRCPSYRRNIRHKRSNWHAWVHVVMKLYYIYFTEVSSPQHIVMLWMGYKPINNSKHLCPDDPDSKQVMLSEVVVQVGCPSWLSGLVARAGCPGWLSELVVQVGCPSLLSGLIVRAVSPGWLSELVVQVGFPSWLSSLVVRAGCPGWLPELVVRVDCPSC